MRVDPTLRTVSCFFAIAAAALAAGGQEQARSEASYERSGSGTRVLRGRGGLEIKILVEAANLGSGEVEVGEITFPASTQGGGHRHGSIEIFYVISGVMNHVVNGESHRLEPGMIGIVKPGDEVSHEVLSDQPVKAVVIWAAGGEAERLAPFFEVERLD